MKENEIRPPHIFDEYLSLSKKDVVTYFSNSEMIKTKCVACNSNSEFAFHKLGFSYYECSKCKTLYVNPRPTKSSFIEFYHDSPSTQFWATTFYKYTEEARREKIWKPKAWLVNSKVIQNQDIKAIVDIGGGYGTFVEELNKISPLDSFIIEPSVHLAKVCRQKKLNVINKFLEGVDSTDLPPGKKCFVSFELIEHLHDPLDFLSILNNLMEPGELFIFTTLSGMGLDIQTLWQHSKSVHPPHHLNFFNPKSIAVLLDRSNYNVLEISTPGKLDIDIMNNNKQYINDRFWKNFIEYSSHEIKSQMQEIISENGFSSHMMIVGEKR